MKLAKLLYDMYILNVHVVKCFTHYNFINIVIYSIRNTSFILNSHLQCHDTTRTSFQTLVSILSQKSSYLEYSCDFYLEHQLCSLSLVHTDRLSTGYKSIIQQSQQHSIIQVHLAQDVLASPQSLCVQQLKHILMRMRKIYLISITLNVNPPA